MLYLLSVHVVLQTVYFGFSYLFLFSIFKFERIVEYAYLTITIFFCEYYFASSRRRKKNIREALLLTENRV